MVQRDLSPAELMEMRYDDCESNSRDATYVYPPRHWEARGLCGGNMLVNQYREDIGMEWKVSSVNTECYRFTGIDISGRYRY